MKITTFNPQILTNNAKAVVSLFEALGFEKRHDKKGIGELNVEGIRMKDANCFYLDISQPGIELPRDLVGIRINVDDFDEAYALFLSHGFKNVYGDKTNDTGSAKAAMMVSPTGFGINLVQHIKK